MKTLYCGDPHATPDAIPEMERLIEHIIATAKSEHVDSIVFLGDQYHTHSVIHLAVMAFWNKAFKRMVAKLQTEDLDTGERKGVRIIAMVGNHDRSGVKGIKDNAMMIHAHEAEIIADPMVIDGILFVPYVAEPSEFVQICKTFPTKVVVCHQTFAGSTFENGFLTPDGVEPNDLPQEVVISGHIHTPQRIGKVWYPGAPRWRTVSDANTERAVWVVEHDKDGLPVTSKAFPTAGVCRPIYALEDTPNSPAVLPTGDCEVVVDLHGPKEYVERRQSELLAERPGIRVRVFQETDRTIKVRESDGLPVALKKFLEEFKAKNGTSTEVLWDLAKERISWLRTS